ncbi:DUF1549 and DUF1553 domain-containing protein [Thalassoglobus polymorphus]|uniref:DUF1549 domain-containing protein n=1 Tax=Thalassoglobus polymorphus TaxID=2527994 RepID=A0A517QR20_9PLAN|nr:DUF1549 and DUF1553 domain-containing protein [Thalassoglobus polymorphus]QDT34074.1 hypothetical protein Mal48_33330 [Thalassoglobus polymorphus]
MLRTSSPIRFAAVALSVFTALASLNGAAQADDGFTTGSSDPLIQFINQQIRQTWEDNEVKPSPVADDAEWIRRVYLDIVGRIPSAEEVKTFLDDEDKAKRSKKVDELLAHPDYVRNYTEVWTNLLIGRNTPDRTSRSGMRKFLRENFARNRPWNEIVYELATAEGHFEENGAVNFILAQLQGNVNSEDYHVEATAKFTRILLGMQVQCTQCHNHPFNKWKQNQFWEFNSFFRQVRRMDHDRYDPETGEDVDDYSELVYRPFDGPVYYEMRNGLVQVAYPKYFDVEVEPNAPNRREELAKAMAYDDPTQTVARAMVNRTWSQFMGYGFTRPVDDMGPHNQASHPELLDRLSDEFVKSGYDIKQLIKWICNTEAYNLTSSFNKDNDFDNPSAGEVPLFSHMYVKTMNAEQLYDSLLIATNAHKSGAGSFQQADQQRERWLRDFLRIFGGNDEDEPTLFSGSIPQALLMMNGPLVEKAISAEKGSYLNSVLSDPQYRSDNQRIQALFVSSLGRLPTKHELSRLSTGLRKYRNKLTGYQDLYWALLNSNEFILNH